MCDEMKIAILALYFVSSLVTTVSMSTSTTKTILITGSTDGIGRLAAKKLVDLGHTVIIHGRNQQRIQATLADLKCSEAVAGDLSNLAQVESMVDTVKSKYNKIDVLINNGGVFKAERTVNHNGWDVRFVVNTVAPFLLTKRLLSSIPESSGRIINVSSAGQAPVDLEALRGNKQIMDDFTAYAQSKLALMSWTGYWARQLAPKGPIMISVNPGSLLGTKMVRDGFGVDGKDVNIGADILVSLALDAKHQNRSGEYYDNDKGDYGAPHPDVSDQEKSKAIFQTIEALIASCRSPPPPPVRHTFPKLNLYC